VSATDNKGKSKENRKKYLSSTGLEASFELGQLSAINNLFSK
jgi:hypothetical protein